MDLVDPRNIELSVGTTFNVFFNNKPNQQKFHAKDIRTGPEPLPDLAVIVMDAGINPLSHYTRPAALPTSSRSRNL